MLYDVDTETLPREELEALQLRRLRTQVERVYANVPFYRKKFEEKGITPSDIRKLEDIRLLPFTEKQDMRNNYPYGLFAVPKENVVRIHASSGTTGKATVKPLNYTWAITLALLSIPLLGQRISRLDLLAIAVSYAGVLVISTRGDLLGLHVSNGRGAALALGSTVIWALYWILNTRDARDPVVGLFLNFAFGLAYVLPTTAFFSSLIPRDAMGIAGAAYVGLFEMGITFVLWLSALKYSSTTAKVGNLIYLSPFLSLFLIHATVGEEIARSTLLGLGLILAGNGIQQVAGRAERA